MLYKFTFTLFRSSHQRCFIKKAVLKNFATFTWKHMCWSLCLIKLQTFRPVTPTQVFSCDYCEIFKNSYFEEHLRTAASVYSEDLLKYKNCVIKICFQRVFEFIKKNVIYKKNFICKEKSGAVKKVRKLRSIMLLMWR